ncbi:MAG: phosphate regulon transcriptional regulator PhoB [Bdellovibrio sp.]
MEDKISLLIIDDDSDIQTLLKRSFEQRYHIAIAGNLATAKLMVASSRPDLIILDEGLPDGSGSDFCHYLKHDLAMRDLPVIMLTSRKELKDKLSAFHSGADDYVVKPFETLELEARIQARVRDMGDRPVDGEYKVDDLLFNLSTQKLSIVTAQGQTEIDLTPLEFKILYFLAKEPGSIHPREQLLHAVWGEKVNVVSRTVDQHISKVRKKIGISSFTVKSSHGKGYYLVKKNIR